ncbi:hypothetical protein ACSBR1_008065 [Camellia fascicularis]
MVDVSRPQLYRAKKKAREVIEGYQRVQYAKVYDYCEIVRLHNPNSVMQVVVDRPNEDMLRPNFELPPVFQRSHFSPRSRCDTLVNNMCESFNNNILEARDKPIISMLEWIRRRVMHKIQIKKEGMEKYTEALKVQARNCFATYCGDRKFEVDCGDTTHIVDLEERKCSCRMWDLSGIPCKHAVSSIFVQREKPEDYVHPYYSKQHYLVAYNSMMHPVLG